ncbi:hypothetical protein [Williamsia muralis]|uniref:Ribosomally synthesized peptide with SipW-like signal peptide n=1 Tax=Williamsia marianensis TaxID=85044 RepID=A0ABU4EPM4_WILMA|nr:MULTISPECIES: hypothetical protein [Williamsia]MDV7133202.1 hypothetical protein [Williamsia muralis]PVY30495.1 hypothetical protein C7458_10426 [Williamsia marianensis]
MSWLRALTSALISRRLRAILSIGMVIGISVVGTMALWSSTVSTQSGVFTTATIDIHILDNGTETASFAFAPVGLLPGQSAAKVITVSNTGSAAFTYNALVSSANALGQGMTLKVVAGATATNGTCGTGTTLTTSATITSTATAFFTGRGPVAASGGTDALCLQLSLPITALASLAGTSGSVVFTFNAGAGI